MHRALLLITALAFSSPAFAQQQLVWQVLGMTTYQMDEDSNGGIHYTTQFPPVLETQYEGREVAITGYLIPIDVEAQQYALSKNPFTSCFFCGNAGPETVIELKFAEPPGRFATDEYLMIKGTLELNRNGSGLFFTLRNAEIHG